MQAIESGASEQDLIRPEVFEFQLNNEHIHHKAIFDAMNQSLDKFRPYGFKGVPPPWSSLLRKAQTNSKFVGNLDEIFTKTLNDIKQWSNTFAGAQPDSELIRVHGYD